MKMQPLPDMARDVVRSRIDKAIASALGVSDDLSILRKLLGTEPMISRPS